MRLNKTSFILLGMWMGLSGCQPSNRQLLEDAETKRLYRKSDIARSLYFKILRDHSYKDDIRYRAYTGLISTLRDQLYNNVDAAEAMERLIQEFGDEPLYRSAIDQWRLELAYLYLMSLDQSLGQGGDRHERANQLLLNAAERLPKDLKTQERLAELFIKLSDWDRAEKYLLVAWELANGLTSCVSLRSLQVLAIHLYQGMQRCDRALEWTQKRLRSPCESDQYSVLTEKAHCYEMMNEPQRAIDILEEFRVKNPENKRVVALLDQLRTRERRKGQR